MSVPHLPAMPVSLTDMFDQLYADKFFYILSFQEPGRVEAEFAADLRAALKKVYHGLSGDAPAGGLTPDAPRDATLLSLLPEPPDGPLSFMSDADLDAYVAMFERVGLTGGFNRYRAGGFDVEADADVMGATVDQPTCFIGGEFDGVRHLLPGSDMFEDPGAGCTDFRGNTIVPGVGHWVQQEAPAETNAALDAFLATLR
jgi:pimeloyl-ACP methyl ester carboxylesterase